MNSRRLLIVFPFIAVAIVAATSYVANLLAATATPSEVPLAPFVFEREGAASPEDAAKAMFRSIAMESPKDFVRNLLLGTCDGPIATLQKFAECLHTTKFTHGHDSFTVFDLPKGINADKPIRVIASDDFDSGDKQVAALHAQMIETYYGEKFMCVNLAAEGFDGLEYRTRIVVAKVKDHWYAIPRCRSAKSFYEIADEMRIAKSES